MRLKHTVEEYHRGKWQPLIGEDKKPKEVLITEGTAKRMNRYSEVERIRYVLKASDIKVNAEEPKQKSKKDK